jgi:electron transfer flavoprotein alpha subunit
MTILVLAEHDNQQLKSATLNTVTAAKQLGREIDLLVCGAGCAVVAKLAAEISGVRKVLLVDDEVYRHQLAENVSQLIVELACDYDYILAAATTTGKNTLPRVAALLDVAQISEVSAVVSEDTFERPIYAGNAIVTVQSRDVTKVMTIRSTAFEAASCDNQAEVVSLTSRHKAQTSRFVSEDKAESERPELTSARVVISGGRGMANSENFKLLDAVADKLGAAVGASRAAVDAGYAPNDMQVGQTGKIVAPDLYIAVGISGAIQHLAGMKDSKVIVAINKDQDAPIFQIADYGLVADLFEAVPELERQLS